MGQLGLNVAQLVRNELPAGFVVADDYIANNLKINQLLLYQQAKIADADKFDEALWPDEWNLLISYLILYAIISRALAGNILIAMGNGIDGSTGSGQVKKIVTGPAEVEYQDTAAAFSTLIKNLTTNPDSIWYLLMSNACALSRLLGIKIPFCKGAVIGAMFVKAGISYCLTDYMQFLYVNSLCQPKSMG